MVVSVFGGVSLGEKNLSETIASPSNPGQYRSRRILRVALVVNSILDSGLRELDLVLAQLRFPADNEIFTNLI
jgi:hypothetical protein